MKKVAIYRNHKDITPEITLESEELVFGFVHFPQGSIIVALQGPNAEKLQEELLRVVQEQWGE